MKQPDFIQIPTQLLSNKNLQPTDRIIYGYIYWMTKLKNDKCFASNDTFAELANCSASLVSKALTRLEENGYIRRIFDEETNHRKEIIPLVSYQTLAQTCQGGLDKRARGGSTNVLQKNSSKKNSSKKYSAKAENAKEDDYQVVEVDDSGQEITHDEWNNSIKKKNARAELLDKKKRISEIFWKYSEAQPKNNAEKAHFRMVNDQFLKPLAQTFEIEDIEKAIKYCKREFGSEGLSWSLSAVSKHILNAREQGKDKDFYI